MSMHSFTPPTFVVSSQNRLVSLVITDTTTQHGVVVGDVLVEQTLSQTPTRTRWARNIMNWRLAVSVGKKGEGLVFGVAGRYEEI